MLFRLTLAILVLFAPMVSAGTGDLPQPARELIGNPVPPAVCTRGLEAWVAPEGHCNGTNPFGGIAREVDERLCDHANICRFSEDPLGALEGAADHALNAGEEIADSLKRTIETVLP